MKKTVAATKQKATRVPAKAAPAAEATTTAPKAKEATRPARKAKAAKPGEIVVIAQAPATKGKASPKPAAAKEAGTTKKDQVLALISRKDGATLEEIATAMGWQRHTVRGFISILGKAGKKVASSKSEAGARIYKAA